MWSITGVAFLFVVFKTYILSVFKRVSKSSIFFKKNIIILVFAKKYKNMVYLAMEQNLEPPARFHLNTGYGGRKTKAGKAITKRQITCVKTLEDMGLNPFREIARLAVVAERNGDIPTASQNWRHLSLYVDAQRKAVDPAENAMKHKQIATLEELAKIKTAVIAGSLAAIDESTVIEHESDSQSAASDFI